MMIIPLDIDLSSVDFIPEFYSRVAQGKRTEDLFMFFQADEPSEGSAAVEEHLIAHQVPASESPGLCIQVYIVKCVLSTFKVQGVRLSAIIITMAAGTVLKFLFRFMLAASFGFALEYSYYRDGVKTLI